MPDETPNHPQADDDAPNVKRVGQGDRKRRIDASGDLFRDDPGSGYDDPTPDDIALPQDVPSRRVLPPSQRPPVVPQPLADEAVPAPPPAIEDAPSTNARLYNTLALLFVVLAVLVVVWFVVVWGDVFSPLNPLPPDTPAPIFVTATPNP